MKTQDAAGGASARRDRGRRHAQTVGHVSWAQKWDTALMPFMGPAQVGIGPNSVERPIQTEGRRCPLCGGLMDEHVLERDPSGRASTRMYCP